MTYFLSKTAPLFLFAVLVFIGFRYNQRTEFIDQALAQQVELVCPSQEIPVGTLTDEADKFHKSVLTSLFQISSAARAQIEASELLMGFEKQYKVETCISSCEKVCVKYNAFGSCMKEVCRANACTGDPYAPGTNDKLTAQLAAVNGYYGQVQRANKTIQDLLTEKVASPFLSFCPAVCQPGGGGRGCPQECLPNTMANNIKNALNRTRRALSSCVTPVNQQLPAEVIQRTDSLYSCQEAKVAKVLNDTQQQCQTNNFFCCSLQIIK